MVIKPYDTIKVSLLSRDFPKPLKYIESHNR